MFEYSKFGLVANLKYLKVSKLRAANKIASSHGNSLQCLNNQIVPNSENRLTFNQQPFPFVTDVIYPDQLPRTISICLFSFCQ